MSKREPRKPYRKPKLKVHGDIRDLTRTKGGTHTDSGSKPATKASGSNP